VRSGRSPVRVTVAAHPTLASLVTSVACASSDMLSVVWPAAASCLAHKGQLGVCRAQCIGVGCAVMLSLWLLQYCAVCCLACQPGVVWATALLSCGPVLQEGASSGALVMHAGICAVCVCFLCHGFVVSQAVDLCNLLFVKGGANGVLVWQ
jgi:hypothetical protein